VFWQHKSLVVNLEQFYMPGKTLFAIAKILDVEKGKQTWAFKITLITLALI